MHEYTKFFKSNKGYHRFIKGIYDKYRSLGKFSGTVKLECISSEEAEVLTRLFGTSMYEGESVSFSIGKFLKIMSDSKYDDFDISVLISEYFDVVLESKKEEQVKLSKTEFEFFSQFCVGKSIGNKWMLDVISSKGACYKVVHERYNKDKEKLRKELENIILLINNLPSFTTFLPIYASSFTGDPHYLDLENSHSTLFFFALSYVDVSVFPGGREDKILLLGKYNILIDNLSNFVITYNLISDDEINVFSRNKESLILNIQNIVNRESFDSEGKRVYVFENPSILSFMMANNVDASVIVSGGFPNTSVYLLLDKLVSAGNILYYNGDYDPEGLLIADKLKKRYGDRLELICYDKESYNSSLSSNVIARSRLKKLDSIENEELILIKKLILESECSGYQENIKEKLIEYMLE